MPPSALCRPAATRVQSLRRNDRQCTDKIKGIALDLSRFRDSSAQRHGAGNMKTLFLVRHAKSSWDDASLPDEERPLNERGKRDAPRMGKRLAKRHVKADLILSSPARRALATAKVIAESIDYKRTRIVVDERLYPGAADEILNIIQRLGKKLDRVMIVGHNPALAELAHRLSSEITRMPTGAVAEFTFDTKSWPLLDNSLLVAVALERPK